MPTTPALSMPDDRHPADQAVTLPNKQRNPICILDEFFVGKISDGQQTVTSCSPCHWAIK